MSEMKANEYWGEKYPEGLTGSITIDRKDIVKYVTGWNEYVKKYQNGGLSIFDPIKNVQDFIFDEFIKDYDEGALGEADIGGLTAYECRSYLTDLTFKRRLNACMRGQKPFECHFRVKYHHMNDWFAYYIVCIEK